jgi:hypothetical protein
MTKKRPRRSQARYPREQLPAIPDSEMTGPWKTRTDRAQALLTFVSYDLHRQHAVEEFLARAAARKLSEDNVYEALCLGLMARLREQQRTEMAFVRQEIAARVRRIRRDLPPLLQELWLIADDQEARDLTSRLQTWMKHADWIDFSGKLRRPRAGTPWAHVLRETRDRLAAAGVKDREEQTLGLQLVGLLEEDTLAP